MTEEQVEPLVHVTIPEKVRDVLQTGSETVSLFATTYPMAEAEDGHIFIRDPLTWLRNTYTTEQDAEADLDAPALTSEMLDYNDDGGLTQWQYRVHLAAQAIVFIRALDNGRNIPIRTDTILAWWMEDFRAGYRGEHFPWLDYDGNITTDLELAVQGLQYHGALVATGEFHYHRLRVEAYLAGLEYAKRRPNMSGSIIATDTSRERTIRILAALKAIAQLYDWPCAVLQTENMMFRIGQATGLCRNEIVPKFSGSVDPSWIRFFQEGKRNQALDATHHTCVMNFLDMDQIANLGLLLGINEMNTPFLATQASMDKARRMFGTARYTDNGEKALFMHICAAIGYDIDYAGDGTIFGTATYPVGVQLYYMLDWFRRMQPLGEILKRSAEQSHWTWVSKDSKTEIISAFQFLVPFKFMDNFAGLAAPHMYWALTRNCLANNFPAAPDYFWFVEARMVDPNNFIFNHLPRTNQLTTVAAPTLLLSLLFYDQLDKANQIYLGATVPDEALICELLVEQTYMRHSTVAEAAMGGLSTTRETLWKARFVEVITTDAAGFWCYASCEDRQERFENHESIYAASQVTREKYALELVDRSMTYRRIITMPRPFGNSPPQYISGVHERANAFQLLLSARTAKPTIVEQKETAPDKAKGDAAVKETAAPPTAKTS